MMANSSHDARINIHVIMCGDTSSGKTCLINKYTKNIYNDENTDTSNAVDFTIYNTNVLNTNSPHELLHNCKLHVFDLSGDKIFENIIKPYINMSDICILCFDTKNIKQSIKYVTDWINTTVHYKKNIYILGTKYDVCNTEIDNIHEMGIMISEYSRIWYSYKNIQFIGVCSSKYDKFHPWTINFTLDKMGIIDNTKQYNINDMFNLMLLHYIKKCVPVDILHIKNNDVNYENIDTDNMEDTNHCSLFCCF